MHFLDLVTEVTIMIEKYLKTFKPDIKYLRKSIELLI